MGNCSESTTKTVEAHSLVEGDILCLENEDVIVEGVTDDGVMTTVHVQYYDGTPDRFNFRSIQEVEVLTERDPD